MNWQHDRLRRAGASLLAASLLLSALPAESFLTAAAPLVWSEDLDAIAVDQPTEAANGDQHEAERPRDGASSVRQRGREAPVDLRQVATDEAEVLEAVGADPGDGPPPARKTQKSARDEQAARDARNVNLRMWPMPAESYTFTQAFGCVPQIAHFYQPGAGCPADRPVVHTGLDLAAPEGTPFYAAATGWVTESGYDREVGVANTRIIIQHEGRNDGYATEYLHWVASFVDVGDHVEAGQLIGEVGSVGYSTGPHLHFSLIDLDTGEHLDPTRWLPNEPGTEGYRGITPRRAAMRLPAGTTAGVPEHTDPSPPDVPTREDLPESADAGNRNKGNKNRNKKEKKREERRNKNGNNRQKDTRDISGKDGETSENGSATSDDKQADRERSRTRKRERNKNGSAQSKNASGEDSSGNSRKERKKKDAGDSDSGKGNKKASGKDKNTVEQTDTQDKGAKGNKGNGNGGGNGGGTKKNRQQDDTQQAVEETPAPADATPQETQEPAPGDTSGRDGQDGDSNADSSDGDRENSGNGGKNQDTSTSDAGSGEEDQSGSDDSASRKGEQREKGGDGDTSDKSETEGAA